MSAAIASESWRSLYPFASRQLILGGGLRYHYIDEGEGEPLLLVHGNPTWSFYWRDVIRRLCDRYRVIAVDHIGCGLSDKPSPEIYEYRLAQRVRDLNHLVESLDLQQVTLVAHDWGGAIGMGAAVSLPDRFARFVLMNTAAFRADRCPWRIRLCHVPLLGQVAVQGMNLFVEVALRAATEHPEKFSDPVRAGYRAPYDSWHNRAAVYRFVCDIPLSPTHPTHETLMGIEGGLSKLRDNPFCFIWGMKDWCFDQSFLDRFVGYYPQATVHRIAHAGHYVVEDATDEVIGHIERFLESHPLGVQARVTSSVGPHALKNEGRSEIG
ncbi:MAG: alpha/beta fold hydrolase [Planctomycetota bacterium]